MMLMIMSAGENNKNERSASAPDGDNLQQNVVVSFAEREREAMKCSAARQQNGSGSCVASTAEGWRPSRLIVAHAQWRRRKAPAK